jgi:hypothetical protein
MDVQARSLETAPEHPAWENAKAAIREMGGRGS